jgi:hypothetical protein
VASPSSFQLPEYEQCSLEAKISSSIASFKPDTTSKLLPRDPSAAGVSINLLCGSHQHEAATFYYSHEGNAQYNTIQSMPCHAQLDGNVHERVPAPRGLKVQRVLGSQWSVSRKVGTTETATAPQFPLRHQASSQSLPCAQLVLSTKLCWMLNPPIIIEQRGTLTSRAQGLCWIFMYADPLFEWCPKLHSSIMALVLRDFLVFRWWRPVFIEQPADNRRAGPAFSGPNGVVWKWNRGLFSALAEAGLDSRAAPL